jgi:DNA-binding transcriptional LysR family regulator
MDTPALQAFVAVAELSSFSLAAQRLHLTQPAVSRRVQLLEEEAGSRLFDRIGRQVLLTEAGRLLLPRAQQILTLAADALQQLQDQAGSVQGQLRLLTSHHIGLHRLPGVLREYKHRFPQVKLNIRFFNSQETQQRILDGEGDIGITTLEPGDAPLVRRAIWLDQLHFVVAPGHALAGRRSVTLQDVAAYPAILPDARFFTGRLVRELFEQKSIVLRLDDDLSSEYLETIKALIGIGESWSVLPQTMLDERELVDLKVKGVQLQRKLVCIHHRDRSLGRAAQAFIDLLEQHRDQRA